MSENAWQAALESGWLDTELADAFAAIALNLATTYFTHCAGTELDLPPAPPTASASITAAVESDVGADTFHQWFCTNFWEKETIWPTSTTSW